MTTVEEVNEDREVTPALQTEDDATMFVGQQRIIQEGEPGQASCSLPRGQALRRARGEQ